MRDRVGAAPACKAPRGEANSRSSAGCPRPRPSRGKVATAAVVTAAAVSTWEPRIARQRSQPVDSHQRRPDGEVGNHEEGPELPGQDSGGSTGDKRDPGPAGKAPRVAPELQQGRDKCEIRGDLESVWVHHRADEQDHRGRRNQQADRAPARSRPCQDQREAEERQDLEKGAPPARRAAPHSKRVPPNADRRKEVGERAVVPGVAHFGAAAAGPGSCLCTARPEARATRDTATPRRSWSIQSLLSGLHPPALGSSRGPTGPSGSLGPSHRPSLISSARRYCAGSSGAKPGGVENTHAVPSSASPTSSRTRPRERTGLR